MRSGIKKASRFLFLLSIVFVFACCFACEGKSGLQGKTTNPVGEEATSESHDAVKSDDNPFGGGLENGGNYNFNK